MPATLSSERPTQRHDDLDNYNVGDLSDDPFASPPPQSKSSQKRKEPDSGLGIEEEVEVKKRARGPRFKLDENLLLGPRGLPKLQARAKGLKLKGKGHEFSDAARLLSFYQLWLDDLFPKAKFVDALAMVEKVGHKKQVMIARNEIMNKSKPRDRTEDDDEDDLFGGAENGNTTTERQPEASSTASQTAAPTTGRPRTPPPANDDVPDDDDLYDATPPAPRPAARAPPSQPDDMPDDDELDELMAEYGAPGEPVSHPSRPRQVPQQPSRAPQQPQHPGDDDIPDDDDLDALLAEAEEFDRGKQTEVPIRSDVKKIPSQGAAKASQAQEGSSKDSDAASRPQEEELEGLWD